MSTGPPHTETPPLPPQYRPAPPSSTTRSRPIKPHPSFKPRPLAARLRPLPLSPAHSPTPRSPIKPRPLLLSHIRSLPRLSPSPPVKPRPQFPAPHLTLSPAHCKTLSHKAPPTHCQAPPPPRCRPIARRAPCAGSGRDRSAASPPRPAAAALGGVRGGHVMSGHPPIPASHCNPKSPPIQPYWSPFIRSTPLIPR